MSGPDDLLVETIDALFGDQCTPERTAAAEGGLDRALWEQLESNGLTLVGIAEDRGGSGGTPYDAAALMKAAGRHHAPVPLADTMLAAGLLAANGLAIPSGPLATAIARPGFATTRVHFGGAAEHVVVVSDGGIAAVPAASAQAAATASGRSFAGDPWLDLATDAVRALGSPSPSPSEVDASMAFALAALQRSLLMAGGLARVVDLSVQYANEREQFGKPIGKFQILQHYLAEMAGEAAAADAAADTALDLLVAGAPSDECVAAIAAAKAYAGRAVTTVNRLAHQLHGAIGYTDEHRLQYSTRRLWAWRDEYGSEGEWATHLGRRLVTAGGPALWPMLTSWPPAKA
jgi:acyl-CoA dehydrogenase